jgi:hypothetical protein
VTPTELAITYWPHAASFATGALARPAWRKTWSAFVLLCRAVVAHEDGDDKTALKDVLKAGTVLSVSPPEPAPPPGTVKEWPKS